VTRICTVCAHTARQEIDKAIVAQQGYRRIASQYGLVETSVRRHAADHLLPELLAAWQAERAQNGQDLADELRRWMGFITKLLEACDRWLTDPDDTTRYDLGPRAHEIMVHYEATERGPGGRPMVVRRKARLSDLLPRVTASHEGIDITLIEHKAADPRKLIIDATARLDGHLRLLAELVGKLQTQGAVSIVLAPEWLTLRGAILAALAPFPEARYALAATIDRGVADALAR
jgi:hypothetical protein